MFKQRWELAKKLYRIKSRPSLFSSPCWLSDSSSKQRESVQTRRAQTKEAKHALSHASSAGFSRCLSALIWSFRFCLNCCYCFGRAAFKQKTTTAARRLLAGSRMHFFTPSFVSAFLASANWKLRETNTTSADDVRRCSRDIFEYWHHTKQSPSWRWWHLGRFLYTKEFSGSSAFPSTTK